MIDWQSKPGSKSCLFIICTPFAAKLRNLLLITSCPVTDYSSENSVVLHFPVRVTFRRSTSSSAHTAPAGLSPSEVEDWNKLYYREQSSISSSAMSIFDKKTGATSNESFIDSFREPGNPASTFIQRKSWSPLGTKYTAARSLETSTCTTLVMHFVASRICKLNAH